MKKIILETKRLILREMSLDDFNALKKVIGDPINMKHYPAPYDDEGVKRWIAWCISSYQKNSFGLWAIVLKETNEFIGDCGISYQNIDGRIVPEIGYHLRLDLHHQGIITEAAKAVRDYAFTHFDFEELYSYMSDSNVASKCVAIRNNMTYRFSYDENGITHRVYSITKEEWSSLKGEPTNSSFNKIILLGPPGAGKSYLSKQVSSILGLPLYHLDMIYWQPDWIGMDRDEFKKIQREITSKEKWVIDGSYVSTLDIRIKAADTIIVLDFDPAECLKNEGERRGKQRSDLPSYLKEEYDPSFIEYIKEYPNKEMKLIKAFIYANPGKKVITLQNRDEMNAFIKKLSNENASK